MSIVNIIIAIFTSYNCRDLALYYMHWSEVSLWRGIKPTVRKTHDEKCEVEVLNKCVFTLKVDTYFRTAFICTRYNLEVHDFFEIVFFEHHRFVAYGDLKGNRPYMFFL